jgi:hypothetical protein
MLSHLPMSKTATRLRIVLRILMNHQCHVNTEDDILWLDVACSIPRIHAIRPDSFDYAIPPRSKPRVCFFCPSIWIDIQDQESNVEHGALHIEPSK